MPALTIDRRPVQVPPGATVLDAAEKLGIEIPTLCFLRGYEPATSCLVCLVKDVRTGQLLPACATLVTDAMQIESETAELHLVRRTALELLLSDHVGDCRAPCFFACPAHMDIPLMLRQISGQRLREAIATIKRDIALPAILGRVCPKPCEKGCRRCAADDAVAVCDLKRFVADRDLASDDPYRPPCKPASGKRVAIVGAGTAGLSAAYYLRQQGHACVVIDEGPAPGGRLRTEQNPETLPGEVLEAEIAQVLRLGIELRMNSAVTEQQHLDQLCNQFDAVLLACGAVETEQVEKLGLKAGARGIDVQKGAYQTSRPGVFAAGNALRGKGLVVRSVADGKEAAQAIDRFLSGHGPAAPGKLFSSRIGRLQPEQLSQRLAGSASAVRQDLEPGAGYTDAAAVLQSQRCFACDCQAHGQCKLERYAAMYGAEPGRFAGQRRPYEVIGREAEVLFEPGKCIQCELCVKIAERHGEPLGLTFVGRGFDVRLAVPFDGGMDQALSKVAAQCVSACPTGALRFARARPVAAVGRNQT